MAATYKTSQMSTRIKLRAFLTVFGGLLILLALGAHHTFGNTMPYLISYLKYRAKEPNINNVDSLWFTATGPPLQVIAFVLGGILYRKSGARMTAAIGAVINCGATFLTYFTVQKSFIALTFTQSVLSAFGSAIAYGTPLAAAMQAYQDIQQYWHTMTFKAIGIHSEQSIYWIIWTLIHIIWFPTRSGLVAGIIVAGYGGSASIFNQVITFYINPDNLSPDVKEGTERYFSDEALLNRVPTCYLVLGGTCAAMQIIGVLLLFSSPSSDENKPEIVIRMDQTINTNSEEEGTPQNKDGDISVRDNTSDKEETNTNLINGEASVKDSSIGNHILVSQTKSIVGAEKGDAKNDTLSSEGNKQTESTLLQLVKQMVTSRNYYILSIILFSVGYGSLTLSTLYKAYGQTFILDDHFLALVGSLSSVFNCAGRPFWGAIMDRFGFKVAIQYITTGTACLLMTILASEWVGKPLFLTWVCAINFCVCGTYSALPAVVSKLYGVSNLGITYGLIRIATIMTGIISAVVGTTLKDEIGWHGVYLLGGLVTSIGFVASLFFEDENREHKQKE